MKPSLTWFGQTELLISRGLIVHDKAECSAFLKANNYYRFSGYFRYFQKAPQYGDNSFESDVNFDDIRAIYDADAEIRSVLGKQLAIAELTLRTHVAYVIGQEYGPRSCYLEDDFYTPLANSGSVANGCIRDIQRSKERYILHYLSGNEDFSSLPIWTAVEAWSFGTLSKCIEMGDCGKFAAKVAGSIGVPKDGFAYRVRSLVYLRNRCAHHSRLWNHSVLDAGKTPNNVRSKAKRIAGNFEPRSVLDVVASLDDIVGRHSDGSPFLAGFVQKYKQNDVFWKGLCNPQPPQDHVKD